MAEIRPIAMNMATPQQKRGDITEPWRNILRVLWIYSGISSCCWIAIVISSTEQQEIYYLKNWL